MSEQTFYPDQYSSFVRLGALIARGYSPLFEADHNSPPDAQYVTLSHPSKSKRKYVPHLRLWSNGTVETSELLWPSHHVPSERVAPPNWQKFIYAEDDHIFQRFVASIDLPTFFELKLRPLWRYLQVFIFRLMFAFCLCAFMAGLVAAFMSLVRH